MAQIRQPLLVAMAEEAPPAADNEEIRNHNSDGCTTGSSVRQIVKSWWLIYSKKEASFWFLLVLSCLTMLIAFPASSILFRLYYVNGGSKRWLLTWFGSAAWPLPALILLPFYIIPGKARVSPTPLTFKLTLIYAFLGFLSAADNFLYSIVYAYLPASTSTLLSSTSLAFTAIFTYLLLGKKLNAFSLNSIAIMTAGAVILGLDSNSDRPADTDEGQYKLGFFLDLLGSALHGLIFALTELLFVKVLQRNSFHLVLEVQVMTSLFTAIFSAVAAVASKEFEEMVAESRRFKGGSTVYYMVLVWASVCNQLGVLGGVAVLYLTSALLASVLNSARVPLTAVAAVICFGDSMSGFKIMSILLTVWSFGSYIYGGFLEEVAKFE